MCEGKDKDDSTSTVVVSVVGFLVNSFSPVCLGINPVFRLDWSCWRPACGSFNLEFFVRERGPILVPRATRYYPRVGSTQAHRNTHGWRMSLVAPVTKTNEGPWKRE